MDIIPDIVNKIYLEHKTDGHFKFYRIEIFANGGGWSAKVYWGRIGNTPQVQIKNFTTRLQAENFFEVKRDEKLGKGYVKCDDPLDDKLRKPFEISPAMIEARKEAEAVKRKENVKSVEHKVTIEVKEDKIILR